MKDNVSTKKTYILIHGAWHTSECWKVLKEMLEENGHEVFSPDLPGHGKDKISIKYLISSPP